jgi:endonuclease YncB( thermonuclease family)
MDTVTVRTLLAVARTFRPLVVVVMFLAALMVVVEVKTEEVVVTHVVDGDTFDTSNGERVRVLAIDSCEANTPGGIAAKADAKRVLLGKEVQLVARGSRERDQYDRLLRGVVLSDGTDFAIAMIQSRHTGAYPGGGDAHRWYVDHVASYDRNGMVC